MKKLWRNLHKRSNNASIYKVMYKLLKKERKVSLGTGVTNLSSLKSFLIFLCGS